MKFYKRKTTFFEKVLLMCGFLLGFIGFYIINFVYTASGKSFGYEMVMSIFLWIIMLFMIITAAISENQKEESMIINYELHTETKLMKENLVRQAEETTLLRQELTTLMHELKKKK